MGFHLLPNSYIKYREYAPGYKGSLIFEEKMNFGQLKILMDVGN